MRNLCDYGATLYIFLLEKSQGKSSKVEETKVFGWWNLILYTNAMDYCKTSNIRATKKSFPTLLFLALSQPALIIIDHGHYHCNFLCLKLSLGSFH